MRDLTIRGRAIALNTLVLSKFWYIGSVLPISTATSARLAFDSENLIISIENMCFKYLWFGRETHPVTAKRQSGYLSKKVAWVSLTSNGNA